MACTVDFRCLDEGFGGKTYKRKRCLQEEELQQQMELQQQLENGSDAAMDVEFEGVDGGLPSSKRQAIASATDPNKPVGRPTYDGVIAGRVSGRNWKQVRTHRSSAVKISLRRTTAEQRSKEKEIKKAYQERKKELKEEIRQHKVEKRKKKEEREKRKQANILLSGTKLQKITNPKTLLKMSKSAKDRKLLKNLPVKEEVTPESAKDRLKKMSHPRK